MCSISFWIDWHLVRFYSLSFSVSILLLFRPWMRIQRSKLLDSKTHLKPVAFCSGFSKNITLGCLSVHRFFNFSFHCYVYQHLHSCAFARPSIMYTFHKKKQVFKGFKHGVVCHTCWKPLDLKPLQQLGGTYCCLSSH